MDYSKKTNSKLKNSAVTSECKDKPTKPLIWPLYPKPDGIRTRNLQKEQVKSVKFVTIGGYGNTYCPHRGFNMKFPLLDKRYRLLSAQKAVAEKVKVHSQPNSSPRSTPDNEETLEECYRAMFERSVRTPVATPATPKRRSATLTSSIRVPGRYFVPSSVSKFSQTLPDLPQRSQTVLSSLKIRKEHQNQEMPKSAGMRSFYIQTPVTPNRPQQVNSRLETPHRENTPYSVSKDSPKKNHYFWDLYDTNPDLFSITFRDTDRINYDVFGNVCGKHLGERPPTSHKCSISKHRHFQGCLVGSCKKLHTKFTEQTSIA